MAGRQSLRTVSAIVGVLVFGLLASPAVAANRGGMIHVLVNFRGHQHVNAADARHTVEGAGGKIHRRFQLINSVAATIPANALTALRSEPHVKSVELDAQIFAFDTELDASWGVKQIGAGDVHTAGNTGQGVKVGVIDTGIDYTHPDLVGVYAGGYDIINNDPDPFDDYGHGTLVAGIIAANMNGQGVVGVAPDAEIYAYKVLDANGEGDYSDLIAALERATLVDHVDVINMSLGGTEDTQALADEVAAVYARGAIMVAASGNVNPFDWQQLLYGCPVAFPGAYPQVFATTFTNPDDALTGYSCTGPEVDFAAPGDLINSTASTGSCPLCAPSGYRADLSGTSFASPHLAGTVALVLAHGITNAGDPTTLADDVKAHLCANTTQGFGVLSTPIAPTDPRYAQYFGCGVVNAKKALIDNPPPTGGGGGGTNTAPVANDDSAVVNEDSSVTIDVLGNDTDAESDALTVDSLTQPSHGTAVLNAGKIDYTPAANYSGANSFSYVASDGQATDGATVSVTVTPVDDAPTASATSATTDAGVPVTVGLSGTDIDSCELTFQVVGLPSHGGVGTLTNAPCSAGSPNGDSASVVYTPGAGYSGSDSFTYRVSDGTLSSSTVTVALTVNAVASGPTMHVGDLDALPSLQTKTWTAKVKIRVHGGSHGNLGGVVVTGEFSNGKTRSCTTNNKGLCSVSVAKLAKSLTSLTFDVTNLALSGRTYVPADNHDPDGDSDGTTIVVNKP